MMQYIHINSKSRIPRSISIRGIKDGFITADTQLSEIDDIICQKNTIMYRYQRPYVSG